MNETKPGAGLRDAILDMWCTGLTALGALLVLGAVVSLAVDSTLSFALLFLAGVACWLLSVLQRLYALARDIRQELRDLNERVGQRRS